jgi:putative tryptophan/tyrosine transport system substrate-binding protein
MMRRDFITLLAVTIATQSRAKHTVAAEQTKMWHIGLFHVGLDHVPPSLPTLRQRLREMGYIEGENLRFDWRNLADEDQARATARQFVKEGVNLIVAFEDQTSRAAKAATTQIPIVFVHVYDPVAAGYVQSLAHPGANLTGVVSFLEVVGKRLEVLKQIVPSLHRALVLVDPEDPITPRELGHDARSRRKTRRSFGGAGGESASAGRGCFLQASTG